MHRLINDHFPLYLSCVCVNGHNLSEVVTWKEGESQSKANRINFIFSDSLGTENE